MKLIVDRVSAAIEAFRKRCQTLIHEFRRRGTILFVSHDMGQVRGLCDRAIWIDRGRLRADGPAGPTLEAYGKALAEEPDDPNRFHFMT